jgi:hypothetical protein
MQSNADRQYPQIGAEFARLQANVGNLNTAATNRAVAAGGTAPTTAGQATITKIACAKLITKSSGLFQASINVSYSAAAGDVVTYTVSTFTDATPGTPLTLSNALLVGFGPNGVALPGNVAVTNNGVYLSDASAGITLTGASSGVTWYAASKTIGTADTGDLFSWSGIVAVNDSIDSAEQPWVLGTTALVVISVTNGTAARATPNLSMSFNELG